MIDEDNSTLTGRFKRYTKVSTTLGGLAARVAGEKYLGIKIDRQQHAINLKDALGNMKGPLMKVAQLLSTIPEALPDEYMKELSQLQSQAPAMGWPFVKRRMQNELGSDWQSKFSLFERQAASAASLGQVHRAISLEGENLACKLQYPDMQTAVEADLKQLKVILSLYMKVDKTISTDDIFDELSDRMREELDYGLEAERMQLYALMHENEQGVHIPKFYPELSSRRLLTMGWLEGEPLLNVVNHDLEFRNKVAYNMFKAWYVPLYEYGIIHGDPHLGNYTVREDASINLLDFGCVRVFEPSFVRAVIDLYKALLHNDKELAVHAYETWGFQNLSNQVIEILNTWAGFVYGPVLEDRTRQIKETTNAGFYGREVAEKVYDDLKKAGGIAPPKTFVFMDRAAIGLGSVFMHLKAEINWYKIFNELIDDFDEKVLETRRQTAFKKVKRKE